MPKKYFRKYLPTHETIHGNRYLNFLRPVLRHHNLWHLHRRSVAGGLAVGLFAGMIPGPVQMLTAAILAIAFRVNLPVAMFTTLYTNPFTTVPLAYLAYKTGERVTGTPGGSMPRFDFEWSKGSLANFFPDFIVWVGSLGPNFLIGSLLLGLIFAAVGYVLARVFWRIYVLIYWHERRRRHRTSPKR